MNTLLKNNDERKRGIFDKSIHKALRIPIDIHETNKNYML